MQATGIALPHSEMDVRCVSVLGNGFPQHCKGGAGGAQGISQTVEIAFSHLEIRFYHLEIAFSHVEIRFWHLQIDVSILKPPDTFENKNWGVHARP